MFACLCNAIGQNFGDLSFNTINGDSIHLNSYLGKKTLFIIAPISETDPVYSQLQNFKSRYLDTVRVVCIFSKEDGYTSSNSSTIQAIYNEMGVILSDGLYTKKSSGTNQAPIMKWLTDKTQNTHFDMDAGGIGHKFFVDETGRLFGVLPPGSSLSSFIIDRIVHSGQ